MNKSDWIALCAAIGTFLGLIPAYHNFMQARKSKKKAKSKSKSPEQPDTNQPRQMGAFEKALYLTALAFVVMVTELVLFSWVAHYYMIEIDLKTMPLNWSIAFYFLFAVPGLLLLLAITNFTSVFDD